ncbi:hypothetical protein PSTT_12084, partial [Puccinia striiformis]
PEPSFPFYTPLALTTKSTSEPNHSSRLAWRSANQSTPSHQAEDYSYCPVSKLASSNPGVGPEYNPPLSAVTTPNPPVAVQFKVELQQHQLSGRLSNKLGTQLHPLTTDHSRRPPFLDTLTIPPFPLAANQFIPSFTPSNPISPSNHPAHQLAAQSTPSVRFRHILPFIQDKNFFNQILNIYQATPFNPSGHDTPCVSPVSILNVDKLNVTPGSDTSPGHEARQAYYPSAIKVDPSATSNQPSDFDLNSLSAGTHNSAASAAEHDNSGGYATSKPLLETDGVVSSEVGDVPGILHQDLHPDGQPRRPMNAFMIFARHRRPAIQAKEPGLKTGEISKRLSHDWKNLPEEDKSHYLEQAKLLKDEFHSRFPEYVYKRRPNNTGKRRSSTSQHQMHAKFACGPGAHPSMNLPPGAIHSGMPHPADVHHYHHHLHPSQGDLYNQGHQHHLAHHHHVQPPSRPLSSIAQHSPKLNTSPFYPAPNNPTSPRYHHLGQPAPGSNCGPMMNRHPGPYSSRAPPPTSTTTVAPSAIHSPRPSSPKPLTSAASNGMSYMRVSNPHTINYSAQPPTSNHYPWFSNEPSYSSNQHGCQQTQGPLSANRSSFSYSSWPSSVGTDSGMSTSGLNGSDACDPSQTISHSRAASYSSGPPIYRPPSPLDRGRQLSLPSHSLSAGSATEVSQNGPDSGSQYQHRSHQDHQSNSNLQNANNHTYSSYASSDIMNNNQRPAYSVSPVSSAFRSNSLRNSLAPQENGEAQSCFDQHSSPNMNQSSIPAASQASKEQHDFVTQCSPLHHPAPPPPPPAAATSHHHHQHSSGHAPSVNTVTSMAY